MRIAIMGCRGIPANYGGFETFAEELAPRLADAGHDVYVYCRTNNVTWSGGDYKGTHLVMLPTVSHKYLDTPVHTLLSVLHSVNRRYDAILMVNAANAVFCVVPRAFGVPVALNVDGIERLRKKWGRAGRAWYRLGELLATKLPEVIVSDAAVIRDYYLEKYGAESTMIPYGASLDLAESTASLAALGVAPRRYVLYVSRLEPENNADLVIQAFRSVETDLALCVVGDSPYADEFKQRVKALAEADPRVILAGGVYGTGYRELQSHAYCYVQATEVGGTHPALVEAMAAGNMIIANGTPENREVIGDAGIVYQVNSVQDLSGRLQWAASHPAEVRAMGAAARRRAEEAYSWDAVAGQYEHLLTSLSERSKRPRTS